MDEPKLVSANEMLFRVLCLVMRGKPDLPPTQMDVDAALAALDAAGFVVVPKVATEEMLGEMNEWLADPRDDEMQKAWQAMLAAARSS